MKIPRMFRLKESLAGLGAIAVPLYAGPFDQDFSAPPQTLAELKSYAIFAPDAVQSIRQPLYDRVFYPAAGTARMLFFQVQQGQGVGTGINSVAGVKTLDDTNMEASGQLPSPKAFLATSIEVIVEAGSLSTANTWSPIDIAFLTNASAAAIANVPQLAQVNDVHRILIGSVLDFFISSQSFLTVSRVDSFPAKSYPSADAAVAQSVQLGHAGVAAVRAVGRPFYLNPPVLLLPNVNFNVSLSWPSGLVATPSTLNARIAVRLDGILYRRAS